MFLTLGHSFYSWRRYCNKHQIRLGGYAMNNSASDDGDAGDGAAPHAVTAGPSSNGIINIRERVRVELNNGERERSPTPPRALFRSTTGKGVAFTDEDIAFLIKLLHHKKKLVERLVGLMEGTFLILSRRSQGKLDMVAFWKDIALKVCHELSNNIQC